MSSQDPAPDTFAEDLSRRVSSWRNMGMSVDDIITALETEIEELDSEE
jgi:hypothetical protein